MPPYIAYDRGDEFGHAFTISVRRNYLLLIKQLEDKDKNKLPDDQADLLWNKQCPKGTNSVDCAMGNCENCSWVGLLSDVKSWPDGTNRSQFEKTNDFSFKIGRNDKIDLFYYDSKKNHYNLAKLLGTKSVTFQDFLIQTEQDWRQLTRSMVCTGMQKRHSKLCISKNKNQRIMGPETVAIRRDYSDKLKLQQSNYHVTENNRGGKKYQWKII